MGDTLALPARAPAASSETDGGHIAAVPPPSSPLAQPPPPSTSLAVLPSPPLAALTPLDVGAFPHLLDIIIENAPLVALLSLRRTSRSVKHEVDRALFRHISVWPRKRWDLRGSPVQFDFFTHNKRLPPQLFPLAARYARVVTFPVAMVKPYHGYDADTLAKALPMVHTVRVINPAPTPPLPLHAPRLVVFTTFVPQGGRGPPTHRQPALAAAVPVIPQYVERLVLTVHTQADERDWWGGGVLLFPVPPMPMPIPMPTPHPGAGAEAGVQASSALSEVVVIFDVWDNTPADERARTVPVLYEADVTATLSRLIDAVAAAGDGVRFVLVDAHRLAGAGWGGKMKDKPTPTRMAVEARIMNKLQRGVHRRFPAYDVHECTYALRHVAFMSRGEYKARVGDVQFLLDTEE